MEIYQKQSFKDSFKVYLDYRMLRILLLGVIEAICFSLQMYLITRSGAVFASQVGYIVTISGVIWGIIIFNETHSSLVFISLILVLMGLLLVNPKKIKESN